jgi:hypothetical protein
MSAVGFGVVQVGYECSPHADAARVPAMKKPPLKPQDTLEYMSFGVMWLKQTSGFAPKAITNDSYT